MPIRAKSTGNGEESGEKYQTKTEWGGEKAPQPEAMAGKGLPGALSPSSWGSAIKRPAKAAPEEEETRAGSKASTQPSAPWVAVNWARATSTVCTATSRWNNSADDDPMNVLDGGNFSYWASAPNVPMVDFLLDFQTVRLIDRIYVGFSSEGGKARNAPFSFNVSASEDGASWQQLAVCGDVTNDTHEGEHVEGKTCAFVDLPWAMRMRFVKFELLALGTGWVNHAIQQLHAWGPADGPSAHAITYHCRGPPTFLYGTDEVELKEALTRGTMGSKMGMNTWYPPRIVLEAPDDISDISKLDIIERKKKNWRDAALAACMCLPCLAATGLIAAEHGDAGLIVAYVGKQALNFVKPILKCVKG